MGIHRLNQFLRDNGAAHVRQVAMGDLAGKKLAVDASIYMYRFLGDRCLLAGIYQMATLLRRWGVTAVFVFDGAPPKQKQEAQRERQKRKEEAFLAHQQLERALRHEGGDAAVSASAELSQLRRKSLRLGRRRVGEVRSLLGLLGVPQMDAPGEADALCAALVASGDCWGCLSDDTDLFACGCPRVLRRLDIVRGVCDLYDWQGQRTGLGIAQGEFQLLCAAAGCDYGPGVPGMCIQEAWERWQAWTEQGRAVALSSFLAEGREAMATELLEAAAVFEDTAKVRAWAPPSGSPDKAGTRAFLGERGFVFAEEQKEPGEILG